MKQRYKRDCSPYQSIKSYTMEAFHKLEESIARIIEYWNAQEIAGKPISINDVRSEMYALLPEDFKLLYRKVNGMDTLSFDKEGFLFYPLQEIIKAEDEWRQDKAAGLSGHFIFADYLTSCWWYGFKIEDDGSYSIGILPNLNSFVVITRSLAEFIELYLADSPKLYEY